MPHFTIETTYLLPVYRQRSYEAPSLAEACRLSIEDDDWDGSKQDHESAGDTYVSDIWAGPDVADRGEPVPIPSQCRDTVQRQVEHFGELLTQLAIPAQPMGISAVDFQRWLPNAQAAVAKARAILEGRRDPDDVTA
ncbi:MAG: hypothetical protein GY873_22370 [Bosea sp.]|jgi:hypothetical protein|uniref:hypothetical protein n=1 Tax=Hyphomicrobiales TaxID=356 RepID=UPI00082BC6E0|nr:MULTISPECIES: hypothetical protein [Hyphomicrobiales]MCP4561747.1 hypothetical protein [Bosea sp. (in: a-proteobacteria)]MCP4736938.1 hypothetical protein [Bosea sp. (in: a-proteobacteria)]MDX3805053.1 hypothetical protein [Bosea sp. (in: a-proteobacteria)]